MDIAEGGDARITFYKDLTTQMAKYSPGDIKPSSVNGTYKLVHDGNHIDLKEEGYEKGNEIELVSLTDKVMQLRSPDSLIVIFTKVKH